MSGIPVTEDEIISTIKNLEDKKTADRTGLSTNLLKKVHLSLITPLKHIFTLSLTTGHVPSDLKIAKITPIFKSGDCLDLNNYRPISLLSIFSKILEKIVCNRLTDHLETHSLLSNRQFGFRKNHSTTHPMTLLLNNLTNSLNSKKHSIVIFCDLKKAFDTCNHSILLSKLSSIGVRGTELQWFKSYLTDRQQFVTIDDTDSILLTILNGVPQGSILGPLLFLIYINDLPNCSNLLSFLFADDTALTASSDNLDELYTFANSEFQKLCTYFRLNKLSLHPDKTKYLHISHSATPPNHSIFINNNNHNEHDQTKIHKLSRVLTDDNVPAIKYLGVYFDPQLNFKYHISQISKKLSNAIYSLKRAKNLLPPSTLKTLYFSLFHCHLVYAIEIWSCVPPSLLNPLIKKQKTAIRIISNAHYNAHTEPLFKALSILPLSDLITQSNLKFFHSYVHNLTPNAFEGTWVTTLEQRHLDGQIHLLYDLRNNDDFYIPLTRNLQLSRFPLYNLPHLWNRLDLTLKAIPSKILFSRSLKTDLISKLNSQPVCNRLLCPACLRLPAT
jgi:hypothetical protein